MLRNANFTAGVKKSREKVKFKHIYDFFSEMDDFIKRFTIILGNPGLSQLFAILTYKERTSLKSCIATFETHKKRSG